jgi:succinate dehydrogenase / fumarate reductase cytochrome b subunit
MVVHLTVNFTAWERFGGPAMYQRAVYQIHSLGGFLPIVEWAFIFLPILFHGIVGLVIIRSGLPNSGTYGYESNVRYTLQRVSGILAFIFIGYHVFHMHGWFHNEFWMKNVVEPLGGAAFEPYNASSTLRVAMQGFVVQGVYIVGLLSCVFHLANGIWTMGITWGIWTSPRSQKRAGFACLGLGLALVMLSAGAFIGAVTVDVERAVEIEDRMYEIKVASGEVDPKMGEKKRATEPPRLTIERRPTGDGKSDSVAAGDSRTVRPVTN